MVEEYNGFKGPESNRFTEPENKQLTNADVARMFGHRYRESVEVEAAKLGIKGLTFFDSPLPHDGSDAWYLVEQYVGNHLILVPVLKPESETSEHSHEAPMVREVYHHVLGYSIVRAGERESVLDHQHDIFIVPLNVPHQVRTLDKPSLTLIVMENARLVPSGRLHIKAEKQVRS